MEPELEKKVYKVIVIGECSVGKTSICSSAIRGTCSKFNESTIGAAFHQLKIAQPEAGVQHEFNIWDTAGQERFHSLLPMYFRDAPICLLVFDVSNRDSFERITYWFREYDRLKSTDICILYLIGNKIDLRERKENCVTREEAEEIARGIGAYYDETSAINNRTRHVFQNISTMIAGIPKYEEIKEERRVIVDEHKSKKHTHCVC